MKRSGPLVLVVAAALLGSCGGSSHVSSGPASAGPAPAPAAPAAASGGQSATGTAASAPSSTASTSAASVAAQPRARPCVAADLKLSFIGQQGGMGHGELGFALGNVSGKSCHTYGFPGVLFLDKTGQALTTSSTRTSRDFFGATPPAALVIAPGVSVSFRLGVTHGIASSAGCTTAYGLQVIAPDDTATLRTAIPDGAYECGTATVSPLRPGSSAFP